MAGHKFLPPKYPYSPPSSNVPFLDDEVSKSISGVTRIGRGGNPTDSTPTTESSSAENDPVVHFWAFGIHTRQQRAIRAGALKFKSISVSF